MTDEISEEEPPKDIIRNFPKEISESMKKALMFEIPKPDFPKSALTVFLESQTTEHFDELAESMDKERRKKFKVQKDIAKYSKETFNEIVSQNEILERSNNELIQVNESLFKQIESYESQIKSAAIEARKAKKYAIFGSILTFFSSIAVVFIGHLFGWN